VNRNSLSKIGISIIVIGCCLLLSLDQSKLVSAQQGNLSKLIQEKYTREIKPPAGLLIDPPRIFKPVTVIYESANTIVLEGELITSGLFNTDLYDAMDLLKTQYGFSLAQIVTSGVGSEANPTVLYIIMTK
jgi:hypothetical protein